MSRIHQFLTVLSLIGLLMATGVSFAQDLTIGNYALVGTKRITRTVYEYTYRAGINNAGPRALSTMATITSNSPHTTVVDNMLTFGDVPAGSMVVSTDTFSIRQDMLYSFRWSDMTWDIKFQTTPSNILSVGPQGGVLHFPSGIVLEIPIGAVTETVAIEIVERSCTEIDPGILAPELSTHQRRCLSGFSAKPDGLVFNVPITAIVPVNLDPGEVPVQMVIDTDHHKGWVAESGIEYNIRDGVVKMRLRHFSDVWVAALKNLLEKTCKSCDTYMSDLCGSSLEESNPYFYNLQPGVCWLPEKEREPCISKKVECCMEGLFSVEVTDVDFSGGECQIVGSNLQISYPECLGEPTYVDTAAATVGCPEGMAFTLEIAADKPSIYRCQQSLLTAELTGTKDGEILFPSAPFPAAWSIEDNSLEFAKLLGDAGPNGKMVEGRKEGNAVISARAIGAEDKIFAKYNLEIGELRIDIEPGENLSLSVGENRELWAPCVACPEKITWSTDKPEVVKLTVLPGDAVLVDAIGRGTATVTAQSKNHCLEVIQDSLTVEVKDKKILVTPDKAAIDIGGSKQLVATVTDGEGCKLEWYSNDAGIATVTGGLVTGVSLGVANITAACGDAYAVAEITVRHPGFTLTWKGHGYESDKKVCKSGPDLGEWEATNTKQDSWFWSGTAIFDGNNNLQSLTTSAYRQTQLDQNYFSLVGGIMCESQNTDSATWTLKESGISELEDILKLNAPYIALGITLGEIYDYLITGSDQTALLTGDIKRKFDAIWSCPAPGEFHDSGETLGQKANYRFKFDGSSTLRYGEKLLPVNETKTSFAKTVEGGYEDKLYYFDCGNGISGEGAYKIDQSWEVFVTKQP